MLDVDLASLYQVTTRELVQAVKRNVERFPRDFMFQLTIEEFAVRRSQSVISRFGHGRRRTAPYAFTEHGVTMIEVKSRAEAIGWVKRWPPEDCGVSSGAVLSLHAAHRGIGITRLALYEAPMVVDDSHAPIPPDFLSRLTAAVAEDRRGDAVRMFLKLVGLPAPFVALMRFLPVWSKLTAVAHTLPYDVTIVEPYQHGTPLPSGEWSGVTMPTLAIDGGKSPAYMRNGMRALAGVLPNATYRTLPGQTHMINAKVLVPVLVDFLTDAH